MIIPASLYLYIYKVLSVRPMCFIDMIKDKKIAELTTHKYNRVDVSDRIQYILSSFERWSYVTCPKPDDAHLPFQGYSTKPRNYWRYIIKKKGLTIELIKKFLEAE